MRQQQQNCTQMLQGYAVGLAADQTKRAAYVTADGELTNNEGSAAILDKEAATQLMLSLRNPDRPGAYLNMWQLAFLVPVSDEYPLYNCTFQGF